MMNTTCYRLVVCEKPSVARSIAAVLGAGRREDGFLSGGGYLVSWCFGHLAELSDADVYDEKYGKWRREDLPILPDSWQYTVQLERFFNVSLHCIRFTIITNRAKGLLRTIETIGA